MKVIDVLCFLPSGAFARFLTNALLLAVQLLATSLSPASDSKGSLSISDSNIQILYFRFWMSREPQKPCDAPWKACSSATLTFLYSL